MNRRLIIALAVVVPLALFVCAKVVTRWRPVALAHFTANFYGFNNLRASERLVVIGDQKFDLKENYADTTPNDFTGVGAWTWSWTPGYPPQLFLDDGAQKLRVYDLPADISLREAADARPLVRFSPANNRVEMLVRGHYFRWNTQSRQLERQLHFTFDDSEFLGDNPKTALSRDGETLILADPTLIREFSTRTGKLARRVPLQGVDFFEKIRLSPFGAYALYEIGGHKSDFEQNVVDARTGRALWQLKMDSNETDAALCPDESVIAVPLVKRQQWQIRDLKTGAILRTLPLVPGTNSGVFSPNGNTLYSVSNGILYRQRAR